MKHCGECGQTIPGSATTLDFKRGMEVRLIDSAFGQYRNARGRVLSSATDAVTIIVMVMPDGPVFRAEPGWLMPT